MLLIVLNENKCRLKVTRGDVAEGIGTGAPCTRFGVAAPLLQLTGMAKAASTGCNPSSLVLARTSCLSGMMGAGTNISTRRISSLVFPKNGDTDKQAPAPVDPSLSIVPDSEDDEYDDDDMEVVDEVDSTTSDSIPEGFVKVCSCTRATLRYMLLLYRVKIAVFERIAGTVQLGQAGSQSFCYYYISIRQCKV